MCWWLMSFDNYSIVAPFRGRLQRSLQENADGFVKTMRRGELQSRHRWIPRQAYYLMAGAVVVTLLLAWTSPIFVESVR